MHDTCGAATNLRLMKVSGAHIGDLWHVRLNINRSMFAPQLFDYISHFRGSTLPLSYGHNTEAFSRVLVPNGIKMLLDQ